MAHYRFENLGRIILGDNWGVTTDKDTDTVLREMSDEKKLVCLLATAVSRLDDVVRQLQSMKNIASRKEEHDDPSSGMLEAFKEYVLPVDPEPAGLVGELYCSTIDYNLPPRVANVIHNLMSKTGIRYASQLTPKNLKGQRGCGTKTTEEILAFKERVLSGEIT